MLSDWLIFCHLMIFSLLPTDGEGIKLVEASRWDRLAEGEAKSWINLFSRLSELRNLSQN